jgi:energy-coupling factor transport system ATP-binding protein
MRTPAGPTERSHPDGGATRPNHRGTPASRRGPLRPLEAATAGVLAGVAVEMVAVGALLPRVGALELLAAVPLAILSARHRLRSTVAAVVAGSVIAFTCAGLDAGLAVVACGVMGAVVGLLYRCGRGAGSLLLLSLVLGPVSALAAVGLLWVLAPLRQLLIESALGVVDGATRVLGALPPLAGLAKWAGRAATAALAHWWLWLFVVIVVAMPVAMLVVWWLLAAILKRLDWVTVGDILDTSDAPSDGSGACAPLPVELERVRFRYPGAAADALSDVDLRLTAGEFVVVVGHNGSGKSTLARVLAGARVTGGTVRRPGMVGLGRHGGTAMVLQRPETQVLGTTLAEDVTWGLPEGRHPDVDALLAEVGLAGMAEASTAGLSGGQLQRLAIASALAREPALLISDESTAMIDAAGREDVVTLLSSLPRRHGTTVVHITHFDHEAARADRIVRLAAGAVVSDEPREPGPEPPPVRQPVVAVDRGTEAVAPGPPVLSVRDVEHWYGYGTPWAHQALKQVNLDLHAGEGLLVTGDNGSGKSTLAWILAGLVRPSSGRCLVDGEPVDRRVGSVAVAFQHPRLQLQRPTVAEDICSAAGRAKPAPGDREAGALVARSLRLVGLPAHLGAARIDSLSGGQLRQVALAGLLAAEPRVLVLDEPMAGLAPGARRTLLETLITLRAGGLPVVVISHDLDGLGLACSRVVRLDGGILA